MDTRFSDIINLIKESRNNAIRAVNTELINLYWNVGAYIKLKLSVSEWGDKTVDELADFIQKNNPELKGFNQSGIYRMIQFYETYSETKFVASLRRQLHNSENQFGKIVSSPQAQFQFQDIRHTLLVELSWTHHTALNAELLFRDLK